MRVPALALALTLSFAAAPALADHKGKIAWNENVDDGFKQAKATGKPIMLYFTADW